MKELKKFKAFEIKRTLTKHLKGGDSGRPIVAQVTVTVGPGT